MALTWFGRTVFFLTQHFLTYAIRQPRNPPFADLANARRTENHPPWGSNPRPQGEEPCALPTELGGQCQSERSLLRTQPRARVTTSSNIRRYHRHPTFDPPLAEPRCQGFISSAPRNRISLIVKLSRRSEYGYKTRRCIFSAQQRVQSSLYVRALDGP
jgi:hypothetical protein